VIPERGEMNPVAKQVDIYHLPIAIVLANDLPDLAVAFYRVEVRLPE
jgi:hypothetical protein